VEPKVTTQVSAARATSSWMFVHATLHQIPEQQFWRCSFAGRTPQKRIICAFPNNFSSLYKQRKNWRFNKSSAVSLYCCYVKLNNKYTQLKITCNYKYAINYITNYWALLKRPPVVKLLKNFPTFYFTKLKVSIIVFSRALQWSLSWVRPIQSTSS
jgi:hypothetical protein